MHQIQLRLWLHPRPSWGSSQHFLHTPLRWILKILILKGGKKGEKDRDREEKTKKERGGEGTAASNPIHMSGYTPLAMK